MVSLLFFRCQVRDFVVTQKIKVRKQVRLSKEKVMMSSTHAIQGDGVPEQNNAVPHADPVPLNSMDPEPSSISWGEPENVALMPKEEVQQEDIPPDISDSDKYFVDNIFSMLRKEETFSGQVKLMEWIMQIQDSSVLIWYYLGFLFSLLCRVLFSCFHILVVTVILYVCGQVFIERRGFDSYNMVESSCY